ncbi:pimeloyl-ACP methyl ester carboxylesterase [Arthrobacter pascens]|uniref:alpha/beta fold hydrolase n=1 Tax=Arthrobacter pascens TaxID=1677 RepID=UPI00277F6210|nr:alpha/beta hydrolase [Arthrobacter pascens]MDQ0635056.1 pimeloyl-ACP methyl ester carboxylesterase [Arthrobacter pascens]
MTSVGERMDDSGTAGQFSAVTVESRDGTLTALVRPGQGVPIVIVHGVIADASAWKQVAEKVSPERPVFVLNRRGRVPSGPLSEGYGVETEVEDLLRWLSTLEGPVDLVGHSYGGLIAVQAIRQGANVRSLVLYEPVAHPFGLEALPLVAAAISAGDLDAAVEIINVDLSGYSQAHVQTLRAGPAWPKLMQLTEPAAAELQAINQFVLTVPPAWTTPTTLIAGELSRNRPPYGPSVDKFMETLDVGRVTILAGQDHLAHVTAPQELAHAINEGLATGR